MRQNQDIHPIKNILNRFKSIFTDNRGYFVTATDTDVGKTYCCSLLQKALNAAYFKPIQAGDIDKGGDTKTVQTINHMPDNMFVKPIYNLSNPLSPHHAAAKQNIDIDFNRLKLPQSDIPLIIEGAGGVLVPINQNYFMIDMIKKFNLPVILVVRTKLGTLNHSFLTLEALKSRNIPVSAILFNGEENEDNYQTLSLFSDIRDIIKIPHYDLMDLSCLLKTIS